MNEGGFKFYLSKKVLNEIYWKGIMREVNM